jgi:hypothetical protein
MAGDVKSSEHKPGGNLAVAAEQALATLDILTENLRGVERLRDNVAALVVENRRLNADNIRLSRALLAVERGAGPDVSSPLRAAQSRANAYQQQVQELLEAQSAFEGRVLELEELTGSMMNMYVASYRLHATLDLSEVLRVIEEILVNFIGARSFAILLTDNDGETLKVASEQGLDGRLPSAGIRPRGVLAEVVGSLTAYVHTSSRSAREGVLAAVPLAIGKVCIGALLVYSLFAQKERLLRNDVELFSLLGGQAASAVVSARLYAKADRKVKTLQAMLRLLDAPDRGDTTGAGDDDGEGRA